MWLLRQLEVAAVFWWMMGKSGGFGSGSQKVMVTSMVFVLMCDFGQRIKVNGSLWDACRVWLRAVRCRQGDS